MKKIGLLVREISEKRIKDNIKDSESVFVIKYSKLSSPDMTTLRQSLKDCRANILVVKNSITRRALKDSHAEPIIKYIDGPCGLVFVKEEPASVSRVLYNFVKEHEQLKLEGGVLRDKVLTTDDIVFLAKLPTKDVLLAQVVSAINSPISGFVMTLGQILQKFVICLDQIKQKKTS